MRRPYNWSLTKAADREVLDGACAATLDWEAGHRTPLRQRDPEAWLAMSPSTRGGYGRKWARLDFTFRQTWCVEHRQATLTCAPCRWARIEERNAAVMAEASS